MTLACLLKEIRDEQLRGKGDIQARTCRIGEQDWDSQRWETHYLLRRQWQVKYRSTFISHFRDLGEKGAHLACVPRRLKGTRKTKGGRDSGVEKGLGLKNSQEDGASPKLKAKGLG